ncbi:hypothetical protein [Xanthomonas phage XacN1]|nr:hypothetical protein [Xanthomonas phage XacN1]BBA65695.1 hypothetical protein [Xanthomonas phage XacN1]
MNEIIQKMFPTGTLNGRGGTEVNGLTKGTVPAGTILKSGQDKFDNKGRREFYAVELDGHVAYLRVCEAYPGSGYDEFAVIHRVVKAEETEEVNEILNTVSRMTS